jgi:hypothetical protein
MRRSQPCVNSPSSVGMGPMRELEFRLLRNQHPPSAPGLLLGARVEGPFGRNAIRTKRRLPSNVLAPSGWCR